MDTSFCLQTSKSEVLDWRQKPCARRQLPGLGCRLSVFPEAALSEVRSRVPTVARRWRAPRVLLSEARRWVPALVRLWRTPHLLVPEGRRWVPVLARLSRAPHLLLSE